MGIGDWFKEREPRPSAERSQAAAPAERPSCVVEFDDHSVTCRRPGGLEESVRWDDLRAVLVTTTSRGPAADDVFWALAGENTGCVVPSEAEGCGRLVERLQRLPGFDNEAVIKAMTCTDDREFVCWRRGE